MSDPRRPAGERIATSSQTVGPFFHFGLAPDDSLGRIAEPGAAGDHIRLRLRVLDGDGQPVPDALLELYQADAEGAYAGTSFSGFGRLATGSDGGCTFETIRPGSAGAEAAHVNVCLFARGLLRHLHTRIYFADDPSLHADPILSLVPPERRATLIAVRSPDAEAAGGATWDLVIRLQGSDETVFFDL